MGDEFLPYDTSAYLDDEVAVEAYLREAFSTGDAELIQLALGNVAKARGMTFVAEKTGMSRTSLYRAFQRGSQPSFKTVLNVMQSLGFSLQTRRIDGNPEEDDAAKRSVHLGA